MAFVDIFSAATDPPLDSLTVAVEQAEPGFFSSIMSLCTRATEESKSLHALESAARNNLAKYGPVKSTLDKQQSDLEEKVKLLQDKKIAQAEARPALEVTILALQQKYYELTGKQLTVDDKDLWAKLIRLQQALWPIENNKKSEEESTALRTRYELTRENHKLFHTLQGEIAQLRGEIVSDKQGFDKTLRELNNLYGAGQKYSSNIAAMKFNMEYGSKVGEIYIDPNLMEDVQNLDPASNLLKWNPTVSAETTSVDNGDTLDGRIDKRRGRANHARGAKGSGGANHARGAKGNGGASRRR